MKTTTAARIIHSVPKRETMRRPTTNVFKLPSQTMQRTIPGLLNTFTDRALHKWIQGRYMNVNDNHHHLLHHSPEHRATPATTLRYITTGGFHWRLQRRYINPDQCPTSTPAVDPQSIVHQQEDHHHHRHPPLPTPLRVRTKSAPSRHLSTLTCRLLTEP